MALPDDESGGVAGAKRISEKSVSKGCRYGESCWMRIVGFWYMGCGEAKGVMSDWGTYVDLGPYEFWESDEEGRLKTMLGG